MPSFDVVSEVDMHEVNNAIDQANREVNTRFDFKGVEVKFELTDQEAILISAEAEFQVLHQWVAWWKQAGGGFSVP